MVTFLGVSAAATAFVLAAPESAETLDPPLARAASSLSPTPRPTPRAIAIMAIVAIAIRDARFMVVVRARRGVAASRGRARVASRALSFFGFFGFDRS